MLTTVQEGGDVPWDLVRQGGLEDGVRGGGEGAKEEVRLEGKTIEEVEKELDGVHGVENSPISTRKIAALRRRALEWPEEAKKRRIVLVEGILLFSPHAPLSVLAELYNIKVLLRSTHKAAKTRREARNGYVTLEGFWQDPPGYFDKVVWPGFERTYGSLFSGGDVEGQVDKKRVEEMGVVIGPLLGDEDGGNSKERQGKDLEGVLELILEVLGKGLTGYD